MTSLGAIMNSLDLVIFLALGQICLSQPFVGGPSVVEISKYWNNVLPFKNFNRNVSVPMWDTSLLQGNASAFHAQLEVIADASFIAYQPSFYQLLNISGPHVAKEIETVFTFPPTPSYATRQIHDGTVYVPEVQAAFFAELYSPKEGFSMPAIPFVWKVDLRDPAHPKTTKVYPDPPLTIANGAYYHNGSVYWVQEGNYTTPASVIRMDPQSLRTEVVNNNFYGHRFNSLNDIIVSEEGVVFFTDGWYGWDNFNDTMKPELANGIYRWDMRTGNIKMVEGAADGAYVNPNGLAFSHDQTTLFSTNRGFASADADGGRTIYMHRVTKSGLSDREIFAYVDSGFPDGIKTDKDGRVYGAVTGSVDVFDEEGTLIGRIKVAQDDVAVNMAWVGHWLYIFGREKIYRVQLNTTER